MADMNDNSRPLPRLGEIVVAKGLVSAEALAHALGVQAQTGEKLGHVLSRLGYVTQHEIERCFTEDMIGPILVREMDALSEGKYSQLPGATFTFSRLLRTRLVTDDMLNGSVESTELVVIKGEAVVQYGDQSSLPFEFTLDSSTSELQIDSLYRGGLRIWLRKLSV